jgi:hypothetical protein
MIITRLLVPFLSKQSHLLSFNSRRAELRKIERRKLAVEAVAAGERFEGGVDLVGPQAGAFHAAAELGVVEFARTRLADRRFDLGRSFLLGK